MLAVQLQPCTRHPDVIAYYVVRHGARDLVLVQHLCSHDGWDELLGWLFTTAPGPGQCDDPAVFLALKRDAHDVALASAQARVSFLAVLAGCS